MMKSFVISVVLVSVSLCSPACAQKVNVSETKNSSKAVVATAAPAETKSESAGKNQRGTSSRASSKPSLTSDQEKQLKSMQRQMLKSFAAAELTDDQKQQADELFAKAIKSVIIKRSDVELSDEMIKKQIAALKEAKNSGKSMKEQTAEAFTSAGFTEEQIKVFKSTESSLAKAKRDFAKLLTDEQLACLPEAIQTLVSKR